MTAKHLDILSEDFRPDSAEVIEAREANWYATTPLGYAVLRYAEADELVADRHLRQSLMDFFLTEGITDGLVYDFMRQFVATAEGAHHTRLRRLVSKAFTRRSVDRLRPRMREICHELLDGFTATGRGDFQRDFADPFSARIICELLGIPEDRHEAFRGWANDLGLVVSSFVVEYRERIEIALAGLRDAVQELLPLRRADPQPDLLTALLEAEEEGDRLTSEELRVMVTGLVLAGQDATQHQLGRAMVTFLDRPDQWQLLAERPELGEDAVEEFMRVAPTATAITRVADEEFVYRDLRIRKGEFVTILLDPVHTDPAVYGSAEFDITQRRHPHLTFGGGPHYCLGAVLARAELTEALPILADRLRDIEPDGRTAWRPAIGITGPSSLPIRFTPSPVRASA